jgi:hypothetical protein
MPRADRKPGIKSEAQPLQFKLTHYRQSGIAKPKSTMLERKICDPPWDPAISPVSLVDYLADQVIHRYGGSRGSRFRGDYISSLSDQIEIIRNTILGNAEERGWTVDRAQLDRPPYYSPHGAETLRLWGRQEKFNGCRTRQGLALASHLHSRRAAQLPGPSAPELWPEVGDGMSG